MTLKEAAADLSVHLHRVGVECYVGVAEPWNRIHVYLAYKQDKHKPPKVWEGFAVQSMVTGPMIMGNLIGEGSS